MRRQVFSVMSQEAILEKVRSIVSEQLSVDAGEVKPESNFQNDLGADSLDTVELVMAMEEAFDIEKEPAKIRDQYGRTTLGQSCLMARRLVEAGVRCVTIQHTDWDTHDENFRLLKEDLLPPLDSAVSTLFADLADRGLSDKTLVLVTGEFGRTPKIDGKAGGRGHFPAAFSLLLSGCGLNSGMCVGQTNRT